MFPNTYIGYIIYSTYIYIYMFFYDQRILRHVCHLNVSTINSRYQRLDSQHPSQVCSVISSQRNDVGDVEKVVSKSNGYHPPKKTTVSIN